MHAYPTNMHHVIYKTREKELQYLRDDVIHVTDNVASTERKQINATSRIRQLETELEQLLTYGAKYEREIMIKRKTLKMLPNATANIARLQDICGASAARLLQLAQEWESHRRQLIDTIRNIQNSNAIRRQICKRHVK